MNTINSTGFKMDPSQMMQQMQDRLAAADVDESGSISKAELTENAPEGANQTKIDKMFERLDQDADGEISAEEQEALMEQMAERINSLPSGISSMSSQQNFDTFSNLLDTLEQSSDDEEQSDFLAQLKSKLSNDDLTDQELASTLKEFTEKYPRIDVKA